MTNLNVNLNATADTTPATAPASSSGNILYLNNAASAANSSNDICVLEQLETERLAWERNELTSSHKRLYSLLTACYMYYISMKTNSDDAVRKKLREELEQFIEARQYKFIAKTHDMAKVVKSVFGMDRRRVSTYSNALRVALKAHVDHNNEPAPVPVEELASWFEQQGGVEEVSRKNKSSTTVCNKPAKATKAADKHTVPVKFAADNVAFSSDDNDKQVILVATYRATGELEVTAVYKNQPAVVSALAATTSAVTEINPTSATVAPTSAPTQTQSTASASVSNDEEYYERTAALIQAAAEFSTVAA